MGFYGCSRFVNPLPEDLWLRQEADLGSAPILALPLEAKMGTATIRSWGICDDSFYLLIYFFKFLVFFLFLNFNFL